MTSDGMISGIVSGLLVSVLIFVSSEIFKKILLPRYREAIYKGVDLDGEWLGVVENAAYKIEFSLILKHVGHQLSGACTQVKEEKSEKVPKAILISKFEGYVRDGYVYGSFNSTNRKQVVFIMVLLHITAAGRNLSGKLLFKDAYTDVISTVDLELKRNEFLPINITQ